MKKSQNPDVFETVAYIHIKNKKLLLSKNKKHKAFYMPGGKREEGEDDKQALIRELREELQIELNPNTILYYGTFEAQAYGKPEGIKVRIICYRGEHTGTITPSAEVEHTNFFTHSEYSLMEDKAPAAKLILNDLKEKGIIR